MLAQLRIHFIKISLIFDVKRCVTLKSEIVWLLSIILVLCMILNFQKINLGPNAQSEIQILTGLYLALLEYIEKYLVNTRDSR